MLRIIFGIVIGMAVAVHYPAAPATVTNVLHRGGEMFCEFAQSEPCQPAVDQLFPKQKSVASVEP